MQCRVLRRKPLLLAGAAPAGAVGVRGRLSCLDSACSVTQVRKLFETACVFAAARPAAHDAASRAVTPPATDARAAQYERKTPVEHVLLRPGMYIGSTHIQRADTWTFVSAHLPSSLRGKEVGEKRAFAKGQRALGAGNDGLDAAAGGHMELAPALPHNPGLLKLFDEILVNACDTMVRTSASDVGGSRASGGAGSASASGAASSAGTHFRCMTRLSVTIDPGSNSAKRPARITIYNNGRGLPVVRHASEGGLWVPELVLGHLLTGSNFADAADGKAAAPRVSAGKSSASTADAGKASSSGGAAAATGGRHGYGAKLTNIFSREFTVRTGDSVSGLQYTQTWTGNMSACSSPVITPLPGASASAAATSGSAPAGKNAKDRTVSAKGAGREATDTDFVEISFTPDLARFEAPSPPSADGASASAAASTAAAPTAAAARARADVGDADVRYEIDAGTLALMVRRVIDAAGTLARFAAGSSGIDAAAADDGSKRGRRKSATPAASAAVAAGSGGPTAGSVVTSDAGGEPAFAVSLNGVPISVGSFLDYSRLFTPAAQAPALAAASGGGIAAADGSAAAGGKGKAAALAQVWAGDAKGKGKAKGKATSDSNAAAATTGAGAAEASAADADSLPSTAEGVAAALSRVAACTVDVGGLPWEVAVAPAGFPLPAGSADAPTALAPSSASTSSVIPALGAFNAAGAVASFVNNIATARGGTHVAAVMDALVRALVPLIQKKATAAGVTAPVTPHALRGHLRLFVSALVRGASFDSQAKDALSTPLANILQQNAAAPAISAVSGPSTAGSSGSTSGAVGSAAGHGSQLHLPDRFVRRVADELGVAALVIDALRAKAAAEEVRALRRGTRTPESRIKAIPKLEDANLAGTKRGHECTLILTEGDSAKALAVAGLAVVGRDRYGVFPLRGKLLNVRDMTPREALGNVEVAALINILGLDFAKDYAGLAPAERGLRYGRLMIMADQDVDGAHIRGLLLNLFHHFWPRLLEQPTQTLASSGAHATSAAAATGAGGADGVSPSFLQSFVTPIIKARRGTAERQFFSIREYEAWRREGDLFTASAAGATTPEAAAERAAAEAAAAAAGRVFGESAKSGWTTKYYKGLGTSTSAEGRAYFSAMDRHVIPFAWGGADDAARLEMAFAKSKADARKAWLLSQPADSDLAPPQPSAPGIEAPRVSKVAAVLPTSLPASFPGSSVGTDDPAAPLVGIPSLDAFDSFGLPAAPAVTAPLAQAAAKQVSSTAAGKTHGAIASGASSASGDKSAVSAASGKGAIAAAPHAARVKSEASTGVRSTRAAMSAAAAAGGGDESTLRARTLTYGEFVDRELVEFSKADLTRSVPSAIDGLKPSQRKVLFACFRRAGSAGSSGSSAAVAGATSDDAANEESAAPAEREVGAELSEVSGDKAVAADASVSSTPTKAGSKASSTSRGGGAAKDSSGLGSFSPSSASSAKAPSSSGVLPPPSALGSEIKVAQLAGYVAETTAYHHGEASLVATIQAMAQDFVGSNNVPLLQPLGQFGTRLQGGKDAASARYIFTRLSPLARLLFPAADDPLLRRREDDGLRVEPLLYVPIVPLALLNGAMGIGTGWSTSVPPFHPLRVLDAVEAAIEALPPMDGPHSPAGIMHGSSSGGGHDWWGTDLDAAEQAAAVALAGAPASSALLPWWRGFHGCVHPSGSSAAAGDGTSTSASAAASATSFVIEGEVELLLPGAERQLQAQRQSASAAASAAASISLTGGRGSRPAAGAAKATASRGFATKASAAAKRSRGSSAAPADDYSSDSDDGGDDGDDTIDGCTTVRISELPVGRWTEDYKAFLADLLQRGSVKAIREYHTETAAEFVIQLTPQGIREILALPAPPSALATASASAARRREQLLTFFRLRSSLSLRNMHLFDARGRIRRFAAPADVVAAFLPLRAGLYRARKVREEASLAAQAAMADAVHGFLADVVGGKLRVSGRSRAELAADLRVRDTPLLLPASAASASESAAAAAAALVHAAAGAASHLIDPAALSPGPHFIRPSALAQHTGSTAAGGGAANPGRDGGGSYDYLLQLPLWRLTADSMQRTAAQAAAARAQLQAAQQRRSADVWRAELQRLRQGLQLVYPELK